VDFDGFEVDFEVGVLVEDAVDAGLVFFGGIVVLGVFDYVEVGLSDERYL